MDLRHLDPQMLRVRHLVRQFFRQKPVGQDLPGMLHRHPLAIVFLRTGRVGYSQPTRRNCQNNPVISTSMTPRIAK